MAQVLLSLTLCATLTGCDFGPSCEERGGRIQFSHNILIYNSAIKAMQVYPQYECVMPNDNTQSSSIGRTL